MKVGKKVGMKVGRKVGREVGWEVRMEVSLVDGIKVQMIFAKSVLGLEAIQDSELIWSMLD